MNDGQVNWIGRKLDRYEIEAEIGRGGTAVVYRAFQPQLERWVAIKVLKTRAVANQKFLNRFQREAKAIAKLHHPNILTVYDYGEEEGMPYIVMEYVPNGTLGSLPGYKPLTWTETAVYALPIAHALAFAHAQGMIHCDVKADNILLPRADWPLLADFGLSQLHAMGTVGDDDGGISGTPLYLSPEQLRSQSLDHRTDIYSFGIVLYHLLTRKWPFPGDTDIDIVLNRLSVPPTPLSAHNADISPALDAAILRALSRNVNGRYQTMDDFIAALNGVPDGLDPSAQVQAETAVFTTTTLNPDSKVNKIANTCFITEGSNTVLPIPTQDELLIGRADPRLENQPEIDLSPHGGDVAGVSREHARLYHSGEGWKLLDLSSTNGTFVNNGRLTPRIPSRIRNGDLIRCGKMRMVFMEETASE
jgi:serine/threonine protein kinase